MAQALGAGKVQLFLAKTFALVQTAVGGALAGAARCLSASTAVSVEPSGR